MDDSILGATNIIHLPLAFIRSGYMHHSVGYVNVIGTYGYTWSHTSRSASHSYDLSISASGIDSLDGTHRSIGFPLRCQYQAKA